MCVGGGACNTVRCLLTGAPVIPGIRNSLERRGPRSGSGGDGARAQDTLLKKPANFSISWTRSGKCMCYISSNGEIIKVLST